MKERPILFSSDMVKAILEDRKTQTRRVIKPQPTHFNYYQVPPDGGKLTQWPCTIKGDHVDCSHGEAGDRLWVRERYYCVDMPSMGDCPCLIFADEFEKYQNSDFRDPLPTLPCRPYPNSRFGSHPSIHMPRKFSRITLEIINIRVERLQEISEEDAKAEGIGRISCPPLGILYKPAFSRLWDSINGKKYPWSSNSWVWAIEFRRLEI